MMLEKLSAWFSKRMRWTFSLTVVALAIAFTVAIANMNMAQNVESRAIDEMNSTISMQVSAYKDYMDGQFQALRLVADMLANGRHFASKGLQPTLNSIINTFKLCELCFADVDGNTKDHQGNLLGSCADREYFQEIIDGSHTQVCEYLATTKGGNEPRVILSIPTYDESGEILGVLFCSKEISVLEHSLFEQDESRDTVAAIYLCDASGQVLAANENGYAFFQKYADAKDSVMNIHDLSDELQNINAGNTAQRLAINGNEGVCCIAAYTAVDECGWGLYGLVDEETAAEAYQDNQKRTESTVVTVVLVFAAAIAYILLLGALYSKRKTKETLSVRQNYENFKNILLETQCAVVEYDLNKEALTVIQPGIDVLKLDVLNGKLDNYEKFKSLHPEYDFVELQMDVELAKSHGKTYSFESLLTVDGKKLYWLRTTIIPITDENGIAKKMLFAAFDVSDVHQTNDAVFEMYENIPAAVYRCSFNGSPHVDYFGDGLCKMLGYTREQIDKIIGPEKKYSLLICEEDRPAFREFTQKMYICGGTKTCEYRMVCADGSLLAVADTMDAKQSSSGIMYGYAIVTDQRTFAEVQQGLRQELADVKRQLEQSRMKNASSQMQPHFLYNALSSIREIVLEDPQYASDLIYDFTTHLRACIRSMSAESMVPFEQELENIKAYVNIEKMRFGDKLQVIYDCQETGFEIIPLSIQPLVENAIRHGIFERGVTGGTVAVRSTHRDDSFIVCVEDDGIGFDFDATMAEIKSGKRDSHGLCNLIFRFETLMHAQVAVESKIGSGTKITVTIPAGGNNESNPG